MSKLGARGAIWGRNLSRPRGRNGQSSQTLGTPMAVLLYRYGLLVDATDAWLMAGKQAARGLRYVLGNAVIFRDSAGGASRLVGLNWDVTEQHMLQAGGVEASAIDFVVVIVVEGSRLSDYGNDNDNDRHQDICSAGVVTGAHG